MDNKEEKKENLKQERLNWNIKPYLAIGLIAFLVIVLSITFFFVIYRYHGLTDNWKMLTKILQPIIMGLVFAYLINPIVVFEERYLLKWLLPRMKREKKARKLSRGLAVAGAIFLVIIVIAVLLNMVIPQLYYSIERLVRQLPGQVNSFWNWLDGYVNTDNDLSYFLEMGLEQGTKIFEDWAKTEFLPQTKSMLTSVTVGVIAFLKSLLNVIIGVIISVYVLMTKETFIGQSKKFVYAVFPADKGNAIIRTVRKANEIFGGFISGKILDSAIIGVLCFIALYLMKMPYTMLVSVIVGVTNVIPFFGPYIGAIPSAILITLANPIQGLYFVIFIIILQQIDGNIIGPRILGESTGLNSFWVVFAILMGGGLFGIAGMVLGVPVFATFYYIIRNIFAYILRRRGLPEETAAYTELREIDAETGTLAYGAGNEECEEPVQKEEGEEKPHKSWKSIWKVNPNHQTKENSGVQENPDKKDKG